MHQRTSTGLLAALGWAILQSTATAQPPATGPSNYVNLFVAKADDAHFPLSEFFFTINVVIPGVTGVSGVAVVTGGATPLAMGDGGGGEWFEDMWFPDLTAMESELDGDWTVIITGRSPSTSTFTLNAALLTTKDFFATATVVVPANGSTGVHANVDFIWTDPTPVDTTTDLLFVIVEGASEMAQMDNSINGTLSPTSTTWDPPLDLELGENEFVVGYVDFPDPKNVGLLVTPLSTMDLIVWGESPAAPLDYRSSTPLLMLGSFTRVDFSVCPADIDGDGNVGINDFLDLLAAWGPNPGHPADLDGDDVVGIVDFLQLLAQWGPCP